MLRFEVQDEDMFGERNFIGQAVFPVKVFSFFIYVNFMEKFCNFSPFFNYSDQLHENRSTKHISEKQVQRRLRTGNAFGTNSN